MECRIRKHDRYHFEIKVAYPLARNESSQEYRLDLFFFLPYQLGVNQARYSLEQFYRDLHYYVRFQTPAFTFAGLLNRDLATSPLTRIHRVMEQARASGKWDVRTATYELKMLGNVVKVHVRDLVRQFRAQARKASSSETLARIAQELSEMLDNLHAAQEEVRALRPQFEAVGAPSEVLQTFAWVDEYLSIGTEEFLLKLLGVLHARKSSAEMEPVKTRLAATAREQAEYRHACGYRSIASREPARNANFVAREGLLKKFCASVLFLSVEQREGDRRARQILYGLAAGVAMAFAAAMAWIAGSHWPERSAGFVVALVVAYIFKDRLKDLLRELATRHMPRWTSDRAGRLVDPQYGNPVGDTRETMRWRAPGDLARDVHQARRLRSELQRAVAQGTEHILHFREVVRIKTGAIMRNHQRATAIDEILRMDLLSWLGRMDNPFKTLYLIDGENRLHKVPSPRNYSVDLVLRLTSVRTGQRVLRSAKLILSRDGIVRIK